MDIRKGKIDLHPEASFNVTADLLIKLSIFFKEINVTKHGDLSGGRENQKWLYGKM